MPTNGPHARCRKHPPRIEARAAIYRSYPSQLENDRKSPTLDLLMRVCGAIGIKTSTLVARVERRLANAD